jgi:hypothetical protein
MSAFRIKKILSGDPVKRSAGRRKLLRCKRLSGNKKSHWYDTDPGAGHSPVPAFGIPSHGGQDMDTDSASRDTGRIKDMLIVLEHARADAWLRRDRKALDALLAPDFVEINTLGRFSRAEVLGKLFPALVLHEFTIGAPVLTMEGPDTAVLEYRCEESFTFGGTPTRGVFLVHATYVRGETRFRLKTWEIKPVT